MKAFTKLCDLQLGLCLPCVQLFQSRDNVLLSIPSQGPGQSPVRARPQGSQSMAEREERRKDRAEPQGWGIKPAWLQPEK